jgi:leader peptidase (prepilin peptidase)/N-methyltransferase
LFAVPITIYDLREFRVPDVLSLGGILAFVLLRVLGWTYFIRKATRGKLGLGDAKFSALIAVAAGTRGWLVAVLVASLAGLLCAAIMIGALKASGKTRIAFAPFLALGGALAIAARGIA